MCELKAFSEKLKNMSEGTFRKLPICEAMLQLHSKALIDEKESSQFVPFLSEVRVGQFEEDMESCTMFAGSKEEAQGVFSVQQISPPLTPHNIKISDPQDLLIEYWIPNNQNNESSANNAIGSSGTAMERRRDKMFHKLGMKKVQRNDSEGLNSVQCINNVARLICSGKHPLTGNFIIAIFIVIHTFLQIVSIDGCLWSEIRFFQISAQWQTHVKYFPVCLLSRDS
ncbi:hypothetical protein DINM_005922 [Dirofilaria immitis]|nr:hypothetical protein [Dirofilaria immitis]